MIRYLSIITFHFSLGFLEYFEVENVSNWAYLEPAKNLNPILKNQVGITVNISYLIVLTVFLYLLFFCIFLLLFNMTFEIKFIKRLSINLIFFFLACLESILQYRDITSLLILWLQFINYRLTLFIAEIVAENFCQLC